MGKCKVLILTHGRLAQSLCETAKLILGDTTGMAYLNLPEPLDISAYRKSIEDILEENKEEGVLILTDLLGGTPFITCSQIAKAHWDDMELITGANLPMLLELGPNIASKNIHELKQIAQEAGSTGIVDLKKRMEENRR